MHAYVCVCVRVRVKQLMDNQRQITDNCLLLWGVALYLFHCDSNWFLIRVRCLFALYSSACFVRFALLAPISLFLPFLSPSPTVSVFFSLSLRHCHNIALFRCTLQRTFEMYFNLAAASLQFVRACPLLPLRCLHRQQYYLRSLH